MGNELSQGSQEYKHFTQEQIRELTNKTKFNAKQIKALEAKYYAIKDSLLSSKFTIDEFIAGMEITNRGVGEIMFKIIDTDGNHEIDPDEFILGLDIFLPDTPQDIKIQKFFNAYDTDNNRTISKTEVFEIVELSLENTSFKMTRAQIKSTVNDLFRIFGPKGAQELNYEQFHTMAKSVPSIVDLIKYDVFELMKS